MDEYVLDGLVALAGGVEAATDVAVARAKSAPRGEVLKPCPVRRDGRFMATDGMLVAEASDLGLPPGGGLGRVFDDAADVGLTLIDPDGREVVYAVCHEEVRDGDLLYWDLRAVTNIYVGPPAIRIYND